MSAAETIEVPAGLGLGAPRPFLKWPGGKRKLTDRILALAPPGMRSYYEPFLGGGAVFFALRAQGFTGPSHLSDVNPTLINVYRMVRDHRHEILASLADFRNTSECYYATRKRLNAQALDEFTPLEQRIDQAARMIFLNKTCFNGLWRENSSGGMNAPFGRYENPNFRDEECLLAASAALRTANVERRPFGEADFSAVGPGDFIYLDPPYCPATETANFVGYSAGGFGMDDQRALRDLALDLASRGARVVISNADVPAARDLYASRFRVERIEMRRNINRDASKRGPVGELLAMAW